MRGLLKGRPAGMQFILVISITLVCVFLFSLLGTVIVAAILNKGFYELADISKWDPNDPQIPMALRSMFVVQFFAVFIIPVFITSRLFSIDSKKYLGLRGPYHPGYYLVGVAILLIAIPFVTWLGELNKMLPFPDDWAAWMKEMEDKAAKTMETLLSRRTVKDLLLNIVFIAVLAAVGEELLFRGVVQRILTRVFKSPIAGIIFSAILFSALHVQFYGFFPRLAMGIILGLLYWYSGSLWVAMLAHFVYDATLIIIAYMRPDLVSDDQSVELGNLAIAGSISLLIVFMLIAWMRNKTKARYPEDYADDAEPIKNHPF